MATKKVASEKSVAGETIAMTNVEATDVKGIQIYFDERQIPQITFSGDGVGWSIRDILHVKRLLTREYKRYLRQFIRKDVKKEE